MTFDATGRACLLLLGLGFACGCEADSLPQGTVSSLIDAETAFAADSDENGLQAALLARLAEGAVIFDPTPSEASAALQRGARLLERATWQPFRADIAASGDLGYTAGHWTNGADGGRYVTVWRYSPDATWRVRITARTAGGPIAEKVDGALSIPFHRGWIRARRKLYQEAARVAMLKADRDMAARSLSDGLEHAVEGIAADSALFLRDGLIPLTGREDVVTYLRKQKGITSWIPVDAEISRAGDLGFTYGLQTSKVSEMDTTAVTSAYVRIWKAKPDSTWQLDVDFVSVIR